MARIVAALGRYRDGRLSCVEAAEVLGISERHFRRQPLDEILSVHHDRQVGKDNCVRDGGLSLQIPPQAHRHHFVKATVSVRHYPDGTLAIFHGPRCLARYRPDGAPADADADRGIRADGHERKQVA